jgi:hypothetical protein
MGIFSVMGATIPAGSHGCLSIVSVLCYQVDVSASGSSLVQRSPNERVVSQYGREASINRWPWPTRRCFTMGGGGNCSDPKLLTEYGA